jgi:uncharacterized membrane protein
VKGFSQLESTFAKCTTCHSSELAGDPRHRAPIGYDYDKYDVAKQLAAQIREQVEDDEMPPPPATLTADEKNDILAWADCGTPP